MSAPSFYLYFCLFLILGLFCPIICINISALSSPVSSFPLNYHLPTFLLHFSSAPYLLSHTLLFSSFPPPPFSCSHVRCKFRTEGKRGCIAFMYVCMCACVCLSEKLHMKASPSPHTVLMGLIKKLKPWFSSTFRIHTLSSHTGTHTNTHVSYLIIFLLCLSFVFCLFWFLFLDLTQLQICHSCYRYFLLMEWKWTKTMSAIRDSLIASHCSL